MIDNLSSMCMTTASVPNTEKQKPSLMLLAVGWDLNEMTGKGTWSFLQSEGTMSAEIVHLDYTSGSALECSRNRKQKGAAARAEETKQEEQVCCRLMMQDITQELETAGVWHSRPEVLLHWLEVSSATRNLVVSKSRQGCELLMTSRVMARLLDWRDSGWFY